MPTCFLPHMYIISKVLLWNTNSESMTFDERITMQIFTRLLATRMVASSESTSSSSERIALSRASGFVRISCCSRGVSEKKATSEPDTRAEIISNRTVQASCMPT